MGKVARHMAKAGHNKADARLTVANREIPEEGLNKEANLLTVADPEAHRADAREVHPAQAEAKTIKSPKPLQEATNAQFGIANKTPKQSPPKKIKKTTLATRTIWA